MLLHDWLVILSAQYNDAYKLVQHKNGNALTAQVDVAFSQCPQLQPLPRLVFALLRNPLLRFHEEGVHPDYRIYLQCLLRYVTWREEKEQITCYISPLILHIHIRNVTYIRQRQLYKKLGPNCKRKLD